MIYTITIYLTELEKDQLLFAIERSEYYFRIDKVRDAYYSPSFTKSSYFNWIRKGNVKEKMNHLITLNTTFKKGTFIKKDTKYQFKILDKDLEKMSDYIELYRKNGDINCYNKIQSLLQSNLRCTFEPILEK